MKPHPARFWIARWFVRTTCAAIAVAGTLGVVHAQQTYPDRPVRFIVPYPPGGITDILARTIASRISVHWGQQMVVDNRAGASGNIGIAAATKAPADGYTIAFGNASTHAINVSLFKNLPFDPIKDFAPITMVARVSNVLLVGPDFPAKNLGDLIALAKSKPGQLTFASNSVGSSNHLTGELLKTMAGIDMVHVPYKSSTTAAVDLIGGRISLMFDNLTTAIPQVKAGRLRPLAVTSERRVAELPDVPTMLESGLKGFVVTPWWGIFAPAATPKPIIDKLNRDIVAVLHSKEVKEYLASQATEVVGNSPQEFAGYLKGEIVRWAEVVKASGATAD
ncbi:MAG: LacI family transcriptional regulator [Betaproteobacteria bacterium RIFCSPLOWO2_12_FULL_62_13]|nr:MAG: LacI family transcriptional regulator [Betaproteobacteria bacterium RIFCSPLOWO2_12_FULL_62_13]